MRLVLLLAKTTGLVLIGFSNVSFSIYFFNTYKF